MPNKPLPGLLLCLFLGQAAAAGDAAIEIEDAWIRSAPPNVAVMAAYLRLINHSDDTVKLIGVSSRQFENVEVHRSVMQDNIMHMEKMEPLLITGKQEISFEPGGFHLMLANPHRPLLTGDSAYFIFNFSNGEQLMTQAKVRDSAPQQPETENGGRHHGH